VKKRLSEKEKEFYNRVDEVLFYKWDPIGISEEGCPRDEYQSYTPQVFRIAIESSAPEPLAEHLSQIATERMGLSSAKEHDLKIANLIMEIKDEIN